ncbi:GLUG motif-containing protein [Bacteroides sp. ET336]|uniref:GLUG motif-containing protein n=1 Tax=Bacteroides sp. ET336 TaxID=2972459 RepID=UPI0021AC8658|nr:GLUG motif-containing protein [Bacteroides sp. ET336]MCR8892569.1 hypothetical protein [Bacteroides sp. ET336]MDN0057065.1 GLUG motif-containing protein [Bacteroides caecigallinarum]
MKTRNKIYDKSRLRLLCLLTALLGLFGAGQAWAQTQPSGAGTQASPYQIGTADELRWFANQVNSGNTAAWAVLTTSINLGGEAWTPIGTSISNRYTGTFDGAGHTIDGMTIQSTGYYMGFVGYLYTNGVIQNLTLGENCSVSCDGNYVGGICGYNYGGTITGCTNHGTVNNTGTGDKYTGGICAYNRSGSTVTGCTNTGTVSGSSKNVGGVCGCTSGSGTVTNSTHTGTVSGTGTYVGGICAYNNRSTVDNCYWLEGTCDKGIGGSASGGTTNAEEKTATEFASGEVAFLLNGSSSDSPVWYQNLGEGGDPYPVPDSSHGIVYAEQYCDGTATGNYGNSPIIHANYANGFCTGCGKYQPAELNGAVYEISNAGQLFWFAGLVNGTLEGTTQNVAANAVLLNNITIPADMTWTPIGNASTIYTGTFDGAGYTISGMKIDDATGYSGLFGNVTGTVRDFTVTGSITITGSEAVSKVGGAVGSLGIKTAGGTVSGVTSDVDITVSAGNDHIGGVVGSMPENSSPTVESCVYTGNITVTVEAGSVAGVVGYIRTGTIQNCANQGGISINTGGNGSVGGILGYCNNGKIYIRNCYNSGSIAAEGTANVGAIVGQNNKTQATVSNCYYLTGSADKGQGQLDTDAVGTVVKDDNAFTSGEVACLLQGDQTVQVWGQTLGTDNYPVLTTDEAKRVYAAKLYQGSADKVSELYANTPNFSSPEEANALLVIEDAATAPAGTNVVVKSGDAYTCANLELTDGADFYTPVAFTAAQATYSRLLAEGTQWGTVALPFDATSVTGAELFRVARQDGDALYVDETSRMADGEPLVFRANAEVAKVDFTGANVTVRATTDAATGSTVLKGTSQTVNPLAAGAYFIYGDKFYQVASGSQIGVKPFRAYIPAASGASTRSAGAASQLRIIFNAGK